MKQLPYTMSVAVWIYPSEKAQWHFVTVPKKESAQITAQYKKFKKGWGSLPVEVTLGKAIWRTSIFPDSKSGTYILPIKAAIRRKEDIFAGDTVLCSFTLAV